MINKDELLTVVDENNNPIEPKPRKEVHQNGYWHRTSHIWVINSQKQILCQQRSMLKDTNPGKWEPFFGGHLGPDVDYLQGAIGELGEELGIITSMNDLSLWKIFRHEGAKEYQGVSVYKWDGDINTLIFEKEEIDQIKWVPLKEIEEFILIKKLGNWSYMGYETDLLPFLEKL